MLFMTFIFLVLNKRYSINDNSKNEVIIPKRITGRNILTNASMFIKIKKPMSILEFLD